jgi:hypothetical protein
METDGESGEVEEKEEDDLVRLLPTDALADVFHRLPVVDLTAFRCVRKAWRDAHRLLLLHLPHRV